MPALVKICGVTTPPALDAAAAAGADYVGFNFYPPSPRHLTARDAGTLAARATGQIKSVGVFVDPDDRLLTEAIAAARLGAIQLHGGESPARAAEVKARFGLPVWKVLPVSNAADIARAGSYAGAADFILFDAKTPLGSPIPGGMGLRFDWQLLARYGGELPWGLAGGLSADNVGEAIRATGAPLVDTASGVESAPGIKDVGKIAAFCAAALRA